MVHKREEEQERYWRGIFEDFRRSKLTVKSYLKHHQLSKASFYKWKERLGRGNDKAIGSNLEEAPFSFIELKPAVSCQKDVYLKLEVPREREKPIRLEMRVGLEEVTALLKSLS